jgi:hypothetical protein
LCGLRGFEPLLLRLWRLVYDPELRGVPVRGDPVDVGIEDPPAQYVAKDLDARDPPLLRTFIAVP